MWRQEERERGEGGTVRHNGAKRRTEGLSVVIYATPLRNKVFSAVPTPDKNRHRRAETAALLHNNQANDT